MRLNLTFVKENCKISNNGKLVKSLVKVTLSGNHYKLSRIEKAYVASENNSTTHPQKIANIPNIDVLIIEIQMQ